MTPKVTAHIKEVEVNITKRQKELLKVIIEQYIVNSSSISSLNLKKQNLFHSFSSATIRNEMIALEKADYLQKEYFSGGRIPTKKGYELYINSLMLDWTFNDPDIKSKLTSILSNRNESIDITIDKSVELISEFLNLPIVVTKVNKLDLEILKKIDIVQISESDFVLFVVTSSGDIYKNQIVINEFKEREDLNTCVQTLNEKLINTPINKINQKIEEIIPELRKRVHQYEFVFSNIISKLINRVDKNVKPVTKIYNRKAIVSQPEIKNNQLNLEDVFNLLENYSTFSQLKFNYLKTGNTLINLENSVQGLSLASTTLSLNKNIHNLTIVGPRRMNYPLIKYILEFINEKLVN